MFGIIKALIEFFSFARYVAHASDGRTIVCYACFELGSHSGAAKQSLLLAKTINEKASSIFCFVLNFQSDLSGHQVEFNTTVPVFSVKRSNASIFTFVLIASSVFQALHLHAFSLAMLLSGVLSRKTLLLKTTLIGDDDFVSLKNSRYGQLKLYLIKHIDANISLSQTSAKLNSKYFNKNRIHVIPNGIELSVGSHVTDNKEAVFCVVGIVCKRKNTLLAIKYFIEHYARHGAKLYVVGPGPGYEHFSEYDSVYYNSCIASAKEYMGTQIYFTGNLAKEHLRKIYHKSLAIFMFSDSEGMPNAVLEAMEFNCVPILSEMNGIAQEIVVPGVDGYIVLDYSSAPSIDDLLDISVSGITFDKVRTNMDIHCVANKYLILYRDLIQ